MMAVYDDIDMMCFMLIPSFSYLSYCYLRMMDSSSIYTFIVAI